jgi:L-ascorbate metabolism protein UlaG (beta-lactamase superfamily)
MKNTLNQIGLEAFARQRRHHVNGGYRNPFNPHQRRGLWPFLKWRLFSESRYRRFYGQETVRPVEFGDNGLGANAHPAITYLNHASVFLRDGKRSLLLDPVFGGLSPFIKDYTPLKAMPSALLQPDVVLVTHGHYDHLDTASLARLNPATTVVAPPGYGELLKRCGLENRVDLDWFETHEVKGWRITCLPANHWTMRNPIAGPNRALWGGFSVMTPSGYTIYFSGDTAFFDGFDQIGRLHQGPFDLAVFNLGAYEPRWFMQHSHLNPTECVTAFEHLGARWLLPIHWGTFRLGDEPVFLPPEDLKAEMTARGLAPQLLRLPHGGAWELS